MTIYIYICKLWNVQLIVTNVTQLCSSLKLYKAFKPLLASCFGFWPLANSAWWQGGQLPPMVPLKLEKMQRKWPVGCPYGRYDMMKLPLERPSGGQNAIKCPTTFYVLVPHGIQEPVLLFFTPVPQTCWVRHCLRPLQSNLNLISW